MSTDAWQAFGIPDEAYAESTDGRGQKVLNIAWRKPGAERKDTKPGSRWVRSATALLGLLAVGLFVVSLAAQYRFVLGQKHEIIPAIIEAVALDLGMAIFSLLALGMAAAGQPARTERGLIILCAAGSAAMNYAAANDGSPRSIAAYVVPPVFLAIVVDRVVAVMRRHVVGDAERSAWAAFGRAGLYALRFTLAAPSTAKGLRRQVLIMTPLPDDAAAVAAPFVAALPAAPEKPGSVATSTAEPKAQRTPRKRGESKTVRFLFLVQDRYGDLAGIDPEKVSRICSELAPEVDLDVGAARSALRPRVLNARRGV
jgi:hypothetical protein